MSNTTMTAKNTFGEGLVMDFAPDNTLANVLTSALNATLLTFNGNEMSLQNDMGNGRVETARLPEGYIPMGSCEFGDIIYIVSYNPLLDKSLIGCFPSPERLISSDEISDRLTSLNYTEFQETNEKEEPTGRLLKNSCKKILYENRLNPGDKYIIYETDKMLLGNVNCISDYNNTSHTLGTFPKFTKIHVVSIEDSGKMTFLDSSVKWYDLKIQNEEKENLVNFYILSMKKDDLKAPDIDEYRTLASSAYSIFQSKVSGKLALFIELEKITGFSCTYDIYSKDHLGPFIANDLNFKAKDYSVYWNVTWTTDNPNINPSYLVLTKSEWAQDKGGSCYYYVQNKEGIWESDYTNNMFKLDSLPNAYPTNNYIYNTFNLSYELGSSKSYNSFITKDSYEKKLEKFLTDHKNAASIYPNQVDGEPTNDSQYYINVAFKNKDKYYDSNNKELTSVNINDDIINNYFHQSIYKKFNTFTIPIKLECGNLMLPVNIDNLIYHYQVTPAMPYGLLDEFAQEGYIDFSKVGSGEINLNTWKYYITNNLVNFTLGLDIYPEVNKGVSEVVVEFYDNQGKAAAYHINNRNSYSGTFSENFSLNDASSSYKLNNIDSQNLEFTHLGLKYKGEEEEIKTDLVYITDNKIVKVIVKEGKLYWLKITDKEELTEITDIKNVYHNDSGTLYSNILYLAKIVVKYCNKDILGNYDELNPSQFKTFYRWMWTNTMYNEYYYSTKDFKDLKFILNLDCNVLYSATDSYNYQLKDYNLGNLLEYNANNPNKYLGALVQYISSKDDTDNISYSINCGLVDTYNTFSLRKEEGTNENGDPLVDGVLNNISVDIILGNQYVTSNQESYEVNHLKDSRYKNSKELLPINSNDPLSVELYGNTLKQLLNKLLTDSIKDELWTDSYTNYKNLFKVNLTNTSSDNSENNEIEYINYKGEPTVLVLYKYNTYPLADVFIGEGITEQKTQSLKVEVINFSKYININEYQTLTLALVHPLIQTSLDLNNYGLILSEYNPDSGKTHAFVKNLYTFCIKADNDGHHNYIRCKLYTVDAQSLYGSFNNGDNDIIDDFGDEWHHFSHLSLFNNSSKQSWWKDKPEEWKKFISPNFSLYGFRREGQSMWFSYRNTDPIGYETSKLGIFNTEYTNTFDSRDNVGIGMSYNINEGGYFHDGHDASLEVNSLYGVGFNEDTAGNYHFLNSMYFAEKYNKNRHNLYFAFNPDPGHRKYWENKYSHYIGDAIVSVLSQMFVYDGLTTTERYLTNTDTLYLDNVITMYTKDIIYKVYRNSANTTITNNLLLNISGINYNLYLKALLSNSNIDETLSDELSLDSNINVILQTCIKNIPLQLQLESIVPKMLNLDTNYKVKIINGISDIYANCTELNSNTIYLYNEEDNTLLELNPGFTYHYIDYLTLDDDGMTLRPLYFDSLEKNPYVYKLFTYKEGQLKLVNDRPAPDYNSYAIASKYNEHMYIHDLIKDEVLIPFAKYI